MGKRAERIRPEDELELEIGAAARRRLDRRASRRASPTSSGAEQLAPAPANVDAERLQHDPVNSRVAPTGGPVEVRRSVESSSPRIAPMIRSAGSTGSEPLMIRRYKKSNGGSKGGNFIGEEGGCHLHIDIAKPHLKVGKDDGSRINFGQDMNLDRMQRAYEVMLARYSAIDGYDDCKEFLEEQGCVVPEGEDLVEKLKCMLVKWGGLSQASIGYYVAGGGREEVETFGDVDGTIESLEDEIIASDIVYADFLDEGGFVSESFQDIDMDEYAAEQNEIMTTERRKVQHG